MQKQAQELHKKTHTIIEGCEIRIRAWQVHNKPLFYTLAIFGWFFSTLAAGAVLDLVLPMLEARMVVKIIVWIVGAFIFLLIFVLAISQKRKKGLFFWYPWTMVFIFLFIILCAIARLHWQENTFSQTLKTTNAFYADSLSGTNTFYLNSNAVLISQVNGLNQRIGDLQQQSRDQKDDFNETKHEQDAKIEELTTEKESAENKLAFFEANPERFYQVYSNLQAMVPANVNQYFAMFSQIGAAVSNINQFVSTEKSQGNNSLQPEQPEYTSNQLAELGIEKLPDGRTRVGAEVTGQPTVILNARLCENSDII